MTQNSHISVLLLKYYLNNRGKILILNAKNKIDQKMINLRGCLNNSGKGRYTQYLSSSLSTDFVDN